MVSVVIGDDTRLMDVVERKGEKRGKKISRKERCAEDI